MIRHYAAAHRALLDVARAHGLAPSDVALCVAVRERGGTSTTDVLQEDLALPGGTSVRRSLLALRPRYLVGGNKRGSRLPIRLTAEGRDLAHAAAQRCGGLIG